MQHERVSYQDGEDKRVLKGPRAELEELSSSPHSAGGDVQGRDPEVAKAADIADYEAYRCARREKLEAALAEERNLVETRSTSQTCPGDQKNGGQKESANLNAENSLARCADYRVKLSGPAEAVDQRGVLGGEVRPRPIGSCDLGWERGTLTHNTDKCKAS